MTPSEKTCSSAEARSYTGCQNVYSYGYFGLRAEICCDHALRPPRVEAEWSARARRSSFQSR